MAPLYVMPSFLLLNVYNNIAYKHLYCYYKTIINNTDSNFFNFHSFRIFLTLFSKCY